MTTLGFNEELVFSERLNPPQGFFRVMTAPLRIMPSILILGVQKGGTSSLYQYLVGHPGILPAHRKEPFFFGNVPNFERGLDWYRSYYPLTAQRWLHRARTGAVAQCVDASTNTFDSPGSAERVKQVLPDAKLVVLLRDPVERAFSHYKMAKRAGTDQLSFEEALEKEEERIAAFPKYREKGHRHDFISQRLGYKLRGHYARHLGPWRELFRKDQLLVLRSEDLSDKPKETFLEVLRFLGLDPFDAIAFGRHNEGGKSKMEEATRARLREHFAPHNEELRRLTGRDFQWT